MGDPASTCSFPRAGRAMTVTRDPWADTPTREAWDAHQQAIADKIGPAPEPRPVTEAAYRPCPACDDTGELLVARGPVFAEPCPLCRPKGW